MRRISISAALLFAVVSLPLLALDDHELTAGSWFISIGLNHHDRVIFFPLPARDPGKLYLRRFEYPSYYLDRLNGDTLTVYVQPQTKHTTLAFDPSGAKFERDLGPISVQYSRDGAAPDPYAGDWTTANPPVKVSIRPIEDRNWTLVMYFPGDPDCAIPRGYYPLYRLADGSYRSSSVFGDSEVQLSASSKLDALVLKPLFSSAEFPQELYDPVRIWKDTKVTK